MQAPQALKRQERGRRQTAHSNEGTRVSLEAKTATETVRQTGGRWALWCAWVGAAFLPIQVWTVGSWLADGPHQITAGRQSGTTNWYAALIFEVFTLAVAVAMAIIVIRGCLRERKFFTFDVIWVIVGLTICWGDTGVNVFGTPGMLFSSNFINLNGPLAHLPFGAQRAGLAPDPLLFLLPLETFGLLGIMKGLRAFALWLRARWPRMSTATLIVVLVVMSFAVDIALEFALIHFGLWNYLSPPWMSFGAGGSGLRYAGLELIAGPTFFLIPALLYIFRDDHAQTLVERGTSHLSRPRRIAFVTLALYGFVQLNTWVLGTAPDWIYLPVEQKPWPTMPAYLTDAVCRAPGQSPDSHCPP